MHTDTDILIVGGGLVGSSLACALDGSRWRVLQVEAQAPRTGEAAWDERHLALARRSVATLDEIDVWLHARAEAHPIEHVHVSSRGDFGAVRIHAAEYGFSALGHTLPARALGAALEHRVAAVAGLERLRPARVLSLAHEAERVIATVAHDGRTREIAARLLVAADGTGSSLRAMLGIDADLRDYGQTALVTTVATARAHAGWAYERFCEDGALALLPLPEDRCGLVWTLPADEAARVAQLDDGAFLAAAQARFGTRLGAFRRAGRRQPWPLVQSVARTAVAPRAVLLGNAAQTLHPIGAQGFNLGLRDVLALRDALAADRQGDPGAQELLDGYARTREPDRRATLAWSDDLVRWFSRRGPLARAARGAALASLERLPRIKRDLAFAMMGYRETGRSEAASA